MPRGPLAALVLLALAVPARAGVVPTVSLQTSLSPTVSLSGGAAGLNPTLNGSLSAGSMPTLNAPALAVPVLPASAIGEPIKGTPAALTPALTPATPAAAAPEGLGAKLLGMIKSIPAAFSKKPQVEDKPGDGPLHPLLTGESKDLGLDGLSFDGGRTRQDGVPAKEIGRGMRGVVEAHPAVDGAVIKTVRMVGSQNPMIAAEELTPRALSEKEEKVARELEALGAGPRFFGKTEKDGELVSVRERIYGSTIEKMIKDRKYGPEEHALVQAMLKKLSDAGVAATDLKLENVMIGRTAADATVKAWLVDGGSLVPLAAGAWSNDKLAKALEKGLKRFKGEPPPKNDAERLDREFAKIDFWGQVAPALREELARLRAKKLSKAELKEYVRREADASIERIKAARGVSNVGFHYNLHGGRREEYVGVGIRATMGDIALRYTMSGDTNYKVYFFQSGEHGGFMPLDSQHGEHIMVKMRMGYALSLFDLDAPPLKAAREDGRIKNFGSISMDFHGMKGVPYSAYLAPPVTVFTGTAKLVGAGKLSWDEETLATVRYLEAAVTAGGPYVPR